MEILSGGQRVHFHLNQLSLSTQWSWWEVLAEISLVEVNQAVKAWSFAPLSPWMLAIDYIY